MLRVQMQLHIYVYGIFYRVTILLKVRLMLENYYSYFYISFYSISIFIHIVREMRTESKEKTQIFKRGLNRYEIGQAYH